MTMAEYKLGQTGSELQSIIDHVETFDSAPTAGSQKAVTSAGIKAALDAKASQATTYTKEEINSLLNPIGAEIVWVAAADWPLATGEANTIYCVQGSTSFTCYGWTGTEFQELATYNWIVDAVPTEGSTNAVSSGGVYDALQEYEETKEIVDNVVDVEEHISRNLLNKDAVTSGRVINSSTGGTSSKDGYNVSEYIPIDSEGVYLLNCYSGGTAIGYACYDSEKVYTHGAKAGSGAVSYEEGDAYIRVTVADTNLNDAMVSKGSTAQQYEPYYEPYKSYQIKDDAVPEPTDIDIDQLSFTTDEKSINLLDNSLMEAGGVNRDTGAMLASDGYYATPFISMNGKNVCCIYGSAFGNHGGAAVYNEQKEYIRAADANKSAEYQSGDYYVRFSVSADKKTLATAYYFDKSIRLFPWSAYSDRKVINSDVVPTIPFSLIGFTAIQSGKNKFDKTKITPGLMINNSGGYTTSAIYFLTDYIPISKAGLISNRSSGSMNTNVYDSDYNLVRTIQGPGYTYTNGDAYIVMTMLLSGIDTFRIEEGTALDGDYEAYSGKKVISPDVLPNAIITPEALKSPLAQMSIYDGAVWIWLPDVIHAVVGDTLQVFFQSIVKSVDVQKYNILCQCAYGRQFHRYFEWTPESATTTPFSVVVKDDNGNVLGQATTSIVVSVTPASNANSKNILCLGSSTTANGIWPHEFDRRLTGTGGAPAGKGLGNINFVGSKEKDGTHFLGMSGWQWSDFTTSGRGVNSFRFYLTNASANVVQGDVYSNNSHQYTIIEVNIIEGVLTVLGEAETRLDTPQASGTLTKVSGEGDSTLSYDSYSQDSANPFWDNVNEVMTFIPYADTYCNGRIDYIYVMLGVNGLSRWQTDFSEMLAEVATFADTLHSEFPNAKLKLMSSCVPSMKLMMPGAGASGTSRADVYGIVCALHNMRKAYQDFANDDNYSSFVSMVDITSQVDSDYNFPITMKDVNTRNSEYKEGYANNTVHAGTDGYLQMADVAFRDFMEEL